MLVRATTLETEAEAAGGPNSDTLTGREAWGKILLAREFRAIAGMVGPPGLAAPTEAPIAPFLPPKDR